MSLTFYIGKLNCLFLEAHRGINVMLYVVPFGPVSEEVIQRLIFLTQHLSQDSGYNCCWEFVDDIFLVSKSRCVFIQGAVMYLVCWVSLPVFASLIRQSVSKLNMLKDHDAESFACFRILLIKIAIFPPKHRGTFWTTRFCCIFTWWFGAKVCCQPAQLLR